MAPTNPGTDLPTTFEADRKPIHTIILDASPLLLHTPGISTLMVKSHLLVTTPSVIAEIRGEEARNRFETLYRPFVTVRSPNPENIKLVKEFARKTGDGAVLSQTDLEVIALAYELECERNGGNWRLRNVPGQKRLNGSPPVRNTDSPNVQQEGLSKNDENLLQQNDSTIEVPPEQMSIMDFKDAIEQQKDITSPAALDEYNTEDPSHSIQHEPSSDDATGESHELISDEIVDEEEQSDGSDEGWITPSNIKKRQARDEQAGNATKAEVKTLQVATMTDDFALQNVLLQMNLNLLSTKTCQRISQIKSHIFRCHACFQTTKDMSKQFCPRCGKPTLTRVTYTTNDKGEVKMHLKANMQWNNKGNVYSIPKPAAGSSNQKWKGPKQGGGQGGWGRGLILTEDQKEYVRAVSSTKRSKDKNLMDEDVLPSILSGDRDRTGSRIRVGAGRNINSRKR